MATNTSGGSRTMQAWRAAPDAPVWSRARGELVRTTDDRTLLDLSMEHGACLWGHATVVERILHRYSPDVLATGLGSTHTTQLRERATDELCAWAREHWQRQPELVAGILHTGAEAVEAAIKTALAATGKPAVVTFEGAYHGSFGTAAAATESDAARGAFRPTIEFSQVRREPFGTVPALGDDVACVVAEPIQGSSGVQLPPEGWLERLREECTRAGALLVLDDVLVGCGRTGAAIEGVECGPDIVTLAKALGGGMVCSAVVARAEVAEAAWSGQQPPQLSTTFYGHPLSCAAVLEVLQLHQQHDVASLAERVAAAVQQAAGEARLTARGRGAIWALDAGEPKAGSRLADALLARGVITTVTGTDAEGVMLLPSLLMSDESLDWMREAIVSVGRR